MELLFALILFSVISSITPGPNNIMIMSSGLNFGIKRSLPHFFGICFGFPLMVLMVGLLMGPLFIRYPLFHQVIKAFGACYMLYLAWQIMRSQEKIDSIQSKKPLNFRQALLFQWINPTAWGMGVGSVAAYATSSQTVFLQTAFISLIFMIVCFPTAGTWMCFGTFFKHILKDPKHRTYFNYTMGLLMVFSIALIFLE